MVVVWSHSGSGAVDCVEVSVRVLSECCGADCDDFGSVELSVTSGEASVV